MKKIKGLDCILLIDDDPATNFFHGMVIKKMHWDTHVQVAMNGLEALDYLTCKGLFSDSIAYPQPGIIFLDINMPKMNGWEFLNVYKDLPPEQKSRIVIAMITTSLNPDDEKRAGMYNDDVKEFFHKPMSPDKLEYIIERYFKDDETQE